MNRDFKIAASVGLSAACIYLLLHFLYPSLPEGYLRHSIFLLVYPQTAFWVFVLKPWLIGLVNGPIPNRPYPMMFGAVASFAMWFAIVFALRRMMSLRRFIPSR
jgi:hypothetical protein